MDSSCFAIRTQIRPSKPSGSRAFDIDSPEKLQLKQLFYRNRPDGLFDVDGKPWFMNNIQKTTIYLYVQKSGNCHEQQYAGAATT